MVLTRAEIMKNEKMRMFIREEAMIGISIESAYDSFCGKFGKSVMEFIEFDYWFYRFYDGGDHDLQCEMDYEKDLNPQYRTITDLPPELVHKVSGNLSSIEKWNLEKTCFYLRKIGDGVPIRLKNAVLLIDENEFLFSTQLTHLRSQKSFKCSGVNGGCHVIKDEATDNKSQKFIENEHFTSVGMNFMKSLAEFPNLKIDKLIINQITRNEELWNQFVTALEHSLKSLPHKIHVKSLKVICDDPQCLLNLVPLMNPGYLEKLEVKYAANLHPREPLRVEMNSDVWSEVQNLEQYKQLKSLAFEDFTLPASPIEEYVFLRSFRVRFESVPLEEIVRIRDILPKFPGCHSICLYFNELLSYEASETLIDYYETTSINFVHHAPNDVRDLTFFVKLFSFSIWRN